MILYLVWGLSLGLANAALPGPFQAFLLSQSLRNGWRHTLPAALAPLISDGPVIALVLLVLTQLPGWFLQGLQIVGGLVLLYLARGAFLTFRQHDFEGAIMEATETAVSEQSLLKGVLMNMVSPGPYIFWSTVGGIIILDGWRESPLLAVAFLLGMYGTLVGGFAGQIMMFGTARQLGPQVARLLSAISAVALFGFGMHQLGQGVLELA